MDITDVGFLDKLLRTFRVEADEHLRALATGLLELEKLPKNDDITEVAEALFREVHRFKGAARTVQLGEIESVCQAVEGVMSALKRGRIERSVELFDVLHRAGDVIRSLLTGEEDTRVQPIVQQLKDLEATAGQPSPKTKVKEPAMVEPPESTDGVIACQEEPVPALEEEPAATTVTPAKAAPIPQSMEHRSDWTNHTDTVRIAVEKLDPLLRQVEEMVSGKLVAHQRVSELSEIMSSFGAWKKRLGRLSSSNGRFSSMKREETGDVRISKHYHMLKEYVDWNKGFLKAMEDRFQTVVRSIKKDASSQGTMVDDLLEDMMNVLMLPCSSLLEMFPKVVRDLARDSGKEVSLTIHGGDLEIDRRILEEIRVPLVHMVRNSIDHGMEKPAEREAKGKPARGTLTISISQMSGNQVEILLSDDGAGIDTTRVLEAARRKGLISEQDADDLGVDNALSLIFRSEVSTSSKVSTISGRGLGLAIAREKVENLGGNITVQSEPGLGTTFRVVLPVTLSTFRGILVRVGDHLFVIPTSNVERVLRIRREDIETVGNRNTIEVNGVTLALFRLGDVLGIAQSDKKNDGSRYLHAMILSAAGERVCFSVDKIAKEQEVLVKVMGNYLSRVRNVAGATVLGTGNLVPTLHVPDLVKSVTKGGIVGNGKSVTAEKTNNERKSVLVVEDSITSRMLLKNILETSGYRVTTSIDGTDAWGVLNTNGFDLVVSDIEMPRMNGFDLTYKIRADEKLRKTPVVLVTSLGSPEDKQRGIEVGADAYITKGSFDQTNLLEIVARLI